MLITNDLRDDGFGAQYQSIIWTILFAEVNGHTFYYTNVKWMDSDISDNKKFIEYAENTMNIKANYPNVYSVYSLKDHVVYAPKAPLFFEEFEKNINKYFSSSSFMKIKKLFYEDKSSPYDKMHLHVAIHIRKQASYDSSLESARCVEHSYFLRVMHQIMNMYSSEEKPLLFHIYSLGKESDFDEFKQFPVEFHLGDSTFDSFVGLVFADILVTSASSFSYTAAFLSNGTIFYKSFWHPPLSTWIVT